MNVMPYLDYNRISDVRKTMLYSDMDGMVVQKSRHENQEQPQPQENISQEPEARKTLPTKEVIDFAIDSGLKSDKGLIGTESNIDNLDVSKAVSDSQKNVVMNEYKKFAQNIDTSDGIVIRKAGNAEL